MLQSLYYDVGEVGLEFISLSSPEVLVRAQLVTRRSRCLDEKKRPSRTELGHGLLLASSLSCEMEDLGSKEGFFHSCYRSSWVRLPA